MLKKVILLGFACYFGALPYAQSQDSSSIKTTTAFSFQLEGMLGATIGPNFYSINVGGPGLYGQVHPHWKVGLGAFPSLYLLENKLGARLGVSPRIEYKNWVFIAPFFHREKTEEWIWSIGVGYKFHPKRRL